MKRVGRAAHPVIDMNASVAPTRDRLEPWSFTKPYMSIPTVIAARSVVA